MGFLSATGNIIEAVLTRKGRDLLTKGQFNITKYAFTDDGVNYNLYDENLGEDADSVILSLPVTEPTTNESAIKNLLVTMSDTTQLLTYLTTDATSLEITKTSPRTTLTVKTWNTQGLIDSYRLINIDNETLFNANVDVGIMDGAQGFSVLSFKYKDIANITASVTLKFQVQGTQTGILSDEISLTLSEYTQTPVLV